MGIALLLIALPLLSGCAKKEVTPTPAPPPGPVPAPEPALPQSGDWTALTEFGEFVFTVAGGRYITKISLRFSEYECEGVMLSGGFSVEKRRFGTVTSGWPITDGQFTANADFTGGEIVIQGKFDETGTHVSGTWEITGTTCSGTWESLRVS